MKKLSLCMLACLCVSLWSCSNNDEPTVPEKEEKVVSFEGLLNESESEYIAEVPANADMQYTDVSDPSNLVGLGHYYTNYGMEGYFFSGLTYTNKQNDAQVTPVTKKGKFGDTYISVYDNVSEYSNAPAILTVKSTAHEIKGVWITNSASAYSDMMNGSDFGARKYVKGDWYMVTATGLDATGKELTGCKAEIKLADYQSDNDTPVNDWIWFDLSALKQASKIHFTATCSDVNDYGMATSKYFCIDGITLVEK